MNDQATEVTLAVIAVLDDLEIRYLIGGSLASTVYGTARATLDSDLFAEIQSKHVSPFVNRLENDFYVSAEAIRDAIVHRTSFNLIHLNTVFKVDIFLPKQRPFDELQFRNRVLTVVAVNPDKQAYIASAEDTILAKLEWYKLGNEISERQWLDVIGVIRVQGSKLDVQYLRRVAAELSVSDLLEQAMHAKE